MDATTQLWSKSQLEMNEHDKIVEEEKDAVSSSIEGFNVVSKAHKILSAAGYVFSIAFLPDTKKDSNYYAVAVARYNTVKIII